MEVVVHGNDLDGALIELKKKILRDGIFKRLKEREEPSPSIRRRDKRRKALRRLKKSQVRQRTAGTDTQTNCNFRFVYTDGQYLKVPVKKDGMHQHEGKHEDHR